jgi:hypothetical protein
MAQATNAPTLGKKPIQLYSLGTPNGQKIGIALEELGLEYDAHKIDIRNGTQFGKSFMSDRFIIYVSSQFDFCRGLVQENQS